MNTYIHAKEARPAFERYLAAPGSDLAALSPSAGVEAMLEFYRDVRARGCDLARSGDMLLFQWGTYDWGRGEYFEFDITRQFVLGAGADEDIWQLSLTFRFIPDEALQALGSGHRWCHSPRQVDEFAAWVRDSAAYAAVAGREPESVGLDYECAG